MKVLTGNEKIKFNGQPIENTLLDFWKWNSSDLLNNTLRGSFAEFIVSAALGCDLTTSHIDWEAYDIHGNNGERIEVKCSAYLQSWYPKDNPNRLSNIKFSISPALEWIPDECKYKPDSYKRHSDIYVFCHYKSKEREPENPLNLDNWDFYVLATYKINQTFGERRSITLKALIEKGKPILCQYDKLKEAVGKEYADHKKYIEKSNGEFYCPLYDGTISCFDCDEISVCAKTGNLINEGIPPLMDKATILERKEQCLKCERKRR